ncbi:MAG: hypothetical protein JRJ08_05235 [Deltaproteobacteria bacterium]|nr:hypothetical protein [Deltaproteobacteria bacterium]
MKVVLYIISILWIALGALLVIYTDGTRTSLKKLLFKDNYKGMAVFPLIIGLILVVGAFYYPEMFWLALGLGLLGIIKGAYLAIAPSSQIKSINEWWFNRASDGTIRLWGLITFLLGSTLLSYLM